MTVIARAHRPVPSYLPSLDQAVSKTADRLRAVLTGTAFAPSSSWTDQRTERGEQTVLEAVRDARRRAITVNQVAIDVASALIWALPRHIPLPDVVVEADGDIAFDWHENSDRAITVTVTETGSLGYAALVGLRPDYGRAPFAGSIPDTVLFNLLRVYPLPTQPCRA